MLSQLKQFSIYKERKTKMDKIPRCQMLWLGTQTQRDG